MPRVTSKLTEQLKNNRGSGIVTVLVTMLFIITLGATLLFTSYTGYLVKVSERGGKSSFYSASTAMDEIKAGIQQAVTEALATAYTDVLSEYTALSAGGDAEIQIKFSQIFADDLREWKNADGNSLFVSATEYSPTALEAFLSSKPAGAAVLVSDGECKVSEGSYGDDAYLRLEGISVTYTSADGYESSVTTDIVITMPDFHATTATIMSSELPAFALIAGGRISSNIGNPSLTGNAYSGSILLSANGNHLTHTSGTLVCAGDISVSDGAQFKTDAGTELWAENISLGTRGAAKLCGRTYVADDLTLAGNRSSAELKGSYYGFGNGSASASSSAIVINGKNTVLDIDGLDRLVLAGVSFVNTTDADIRTGESVSAKSDQLAYLLDESCIAVTAYFDDNGNGVFDAGDRESAVTGKNPCVFTGDHITYTINTGTPIWGGTKTLAHYGVSQIYDEATGTYSYTGVTPVLKNLTGTGGYKMAYFFIHFNTQAGANDYFSDFFSENPDRIAEYIDVYVNLSDSAKITTTAGNTLYTDSEDGLSLLPSAATVNVEGRAAQFYNRCQTLNPGKGSPGSTPYSYYVNEDAIDRNINFTLPGDESGDVMARIIHGDYTIDDAFESAGVIISTGNVTVSADFSGLIIAGGNVMLNASVSYRPADIENILYKAVDDSGNLLSAYLLNTVAGGSEGSGLTSSWDLDLLVSYANWLKD